MEGLRSSRRSSRRLMAEINVVPYIDVMLVLVVILMVAAPFVNPSLVNLPSVKKAEKAPETIVEVIVHPTVKKAQEGRADIPVVIAADKVVQYEQVVNVMKQLQAADIARVGLSLKVEK